jgi:antitoxin YefM
MRFPLRTTCTSAGDVADHDCLAGKRTVAQALGCARILYMATLPVADARAQFSKLVDEATSTHERFEITRNGQRVAVLLGADDYDSLRETIAVLGDSELLRGHLEGLAAIRAGDVVDAEGLERAMRSAGRPSPAK